MESFFAVKKQDLERLSPDKAVEFFRRLLWAEATTIGVGKDLINVPSAITVADGGVDAEVQNAQTRGGQGIIKTGLNRYQIKTGDFSLGSDKNIREILFRENSNQLKPKIKSCFDQGGRLVVVLFGWDNPETEDDQLKKKFVQKLNKQYKNAQIEIWRQNQILSFLESYPSLRLELLDRQNLKFFPHDSWSKFLDMQLALQAGAPQQDFINKLRDGLRTEEEPVHIRVIGDPGIGKTKLVLEATRIDDLKPLVIYCESPKHITSSYFIEQLLLPDNTFQVILIVDECDQIYKADFWNKLQQVSPRIKLVTIYSEPDESGGRTNYLYPLMLEDEQIIKIFQSYGFKKEQVSRWVPYCSGSPRAAHVIGQNLRANPGDILRVPDNVPVWDRYIAGKDDLKSDSFKERRVVLLGLSLFKRFGYGVPVEREAKAIASKIEKETGIKWRKFQEIVEDLRKRKILQGETTLYITPKILHIKLWVEWWNQYGKTEEFDLEKLKKDFGDEKPYELSDKLLGWFFEMFHYANESQAASRVVRELLGENGPFQKSQFLTTKLGGRFFLAFTDADPKSALECLKTNIGKLSKDELLHFTSGRREVVWALERIVMYKDLFTEAARLLLALGEAENENFSNNASGIFSELFSPAPGKVAPTEASPEIRFPLLVEALESSSKERRLIALRAIDKALESEYFTRSVGAEHQGLRKEPKLWTPATYKEIFDAYRRVWRLLLDHMSRLPEDERQIAIGIILKRTRGLGSIQNLVDMIIDTISDLVHKHESKTKHVIEVISRILYYDRDHLQPETVKRWEQLEAELIGNDFPSLLKRYVGMRLLDDEIRERNNDTQGARSAIENLAEKAITNKKWLRDELNWLVTSEAENGYRFGYEIGKRDNNQVSLSEIIDAQRKSTQNASIVFLSGYFRVLFEKDVNIWEEQLDALSKDKKLNFWIPELTWRSGISDRAILRVIKLLEDGAVSIDDLQGFGIGNFTNSLSENVFIKWINYLLSVSTPNALSIILNNYYFYYADQDSQHTLPEALTLELLTHPVLFQKPGEIKDPILDHFWANIGNKFMRLYPNQSLILANFIIDHFGESGTIFDRFHFDVQRLLNEITKLHTQYIWEHLTKYLESPNDPRLFSITQWLRGDDFFQKEGDGAITLFPAEIIWNWVEADVENRAWKLAYDIIPPKLFRDEAKTCYAREILVRYGNRKDVRRNLMANFDTGGYYGSESLHYQTKIKLLLNFTEKEENENVRLWINEYASSLGKRVEIAQIEEEREDY